MNLKSATPLKVTEDPSKALSPVHVPEGGVDVIVTKGDPASPDSMEISEVDRAELDAMNTEQQPRTRTGAPSPAICAKRSLEATRAR